MFWLLRLDIDNPSCNCNKNGVKTKYVEIYLESSAHFASTHRKEGATQEALPAPKDHFSSEIRQRSGLLQDDH